MQPYYSARLWFSGSAAGELGCIKGMSSSQQGGWKPWPLLQEPHEKKPLLQASTRAATFKETPSWSGLSEEIWSGCPLAVWICMGVPSCLKTLGIQGRKPVTIKNVTIKQLISNCSPPIDEELLSSVCPSQAAKAVSCSPHHHPPFDEIDIWIMLGHTCHKLKRYHESSVLAEWGRKPPPVWVTIIKAGRLELCRDLSDWLFSSSTRNKQEMSSLRKELWCWLRCSKWPVIPVSSHSVTLPSGSVTWTAVSIIHRKRLRSREASRGAWCLPIVIGSKCHICLLMEVCVCMYACVQFHPLW